VSVALLTRACQFAPHLGVLLGLAVAVSTATASDTAVTQRDRAVTNMSPVRPLTLNQKADGYRGIWYAIRVRDDEAPIKYSGGMGTYCAKHQPFAIYRPEVDKTFFCYGGAVAGNDVHLLHMVSYFDHATGEVPRPTILLDKQTSDAHDNPVISVDAAGHIWIFSPSHGLARPSYIHRSKRPYDIDEFELITPTYHDGTRKKVIDNFSYVQVFHQPEVGFSCFFTRYGAPAGRTSYFMSSRDGTHWENYGAVAAIDRGHYQIGGVGKGKVATMMNYHPQVDGIDRRTNVYYLESTDQGQTWQSAAGEKLELPLTKPQNAALVHDYEAEGLLVFVKDLKFDEQGNPVLLYVTSRHFNHGPQGDPRTFVVSRFADGQWRHTPVTTTDHNYDYGSLDLRTTPWRMLAASGAGPQAGYTGGEIVFYTSDDQGATWKPGPEVTSGSRVNQNYPRIAIDAHPNFYALWADGNPLRVSPSQLYFCNARGEVFRLPSRMEVDRAKPERVEPMRATTAAN
jgi:hypothetical protein